MSYQPLHHKYRPKTFAELVGQEAVSRTLTSAIVARKIAPAYLLTGPRGTGKTSSARILAKSLNCKASEQPTPEPCGVCKVCLGIGNDSALDVVEIDAASNTGVDNIREIIERAQFAPVQCRYKVYIIDEVHMLSQAAFNALLKTLEEPPEHVVFVLATTDPQRVLPTIISRCQRFDFRRIPLEAMVSHLSQIADQENINIAPNALTLVAQLAQGGLRDAESLLDQLSLLPGQITVEEVWDLVGVVPEQDLLALTKAIASDSTQLVLDQCRHLMDRGREPLVVLQNLAGFYRDLLIAKTAPNRHDLVALTPPTWKELCEFAKPLLVSSILHGQQHLKNSEAQIKNTTQPRLWLEVTLLGLLPSAETPEPREKPLRFAPTNQLQTARTDSVTSPTNPPSDRFEEVKKVTLEQRSKANSVVPDFSTAGNLPPKQQLEQTSETLQSPLQPKDAELTETKTTESAARTQLSELEVIWQKVIDNTELPGTRQLLQDYCCLLSFNQHQACLGVSKKGMLKQIQKTAPQIGKAFSIVHEGQIKLSFQLVEATESQSVVSHELGANSIETTSPATTNTSTRQPDKLRSFDGEMLRQQQDVKYSSEIGKPSHNQELVSEKSLMGTEQTSSLLPLKPTTEQTQNLEEDKSIVPTEVLSKSSVPQTLQKSDWDAAQVEKALDSLRSFFEGEIVEFKDDFTEDKLVVTDQPQRLEEVNGNSNRSESSSETYQEPSNSTKSVANHQPQLGQVSELEELQESLGERDWQFDEDGDLAF
ncbi:MAG: DNA polymerase III subunit gamma/tau [Coleofasciculaceae cyanobacterium]